MGHYYFQKIGISVILLTLLFLPFIGSAQVGIGTTTPDSNALLELDASTTAGGLLLPRVALTATNVSAPLSGAVAPGMTVYNTATAGSGANAVTPGFYYHDGTIWIRVGSDADAKNNWSLTGNSGTNPTDHFLGTKDAQPLLIKTNGIERIRVLADGRVIINSNMVFASSFNSFAAGSNMAIAARAVDDNAVYGDTDGSGDAIFGISVGTGDGVVGQSLLGDGVVGLSVSGIGVVAVSQDSQEMGLLSAGNNVPGVLGGPIGLGASLSGSDYGGGGFGRTPSGTGMIGVGNDGLTIHSLVEGSGVAGTGDKIGVYGYAVNGTANNTNSGNSGGYFALGTSSAPTSIVRAYANIAGYHRGEVPTSDGNIGNNNTSNYYGGFFAGGVGTSSTDPSYAYVGIKHDANNNGRGGTNYKIIGNGTVSTLVNDSEGNKRVLFAPEAPEILFEDYGVGQLSNGSVYVKIDPLFAKSIHVSEKHPLKVFIQLEGECNGVFVTDKTANGFLVKELNGGTSNTPFSYHLVANRADDIASDGSIASKHVGMRFPYGPEPLEMAEMKAVEMKEAKSKKLVRKEIQNSDLNSSSNIQTRKQNSYSESQRSQHQSTDSAVKTSKTEKN